MNLTVRPLKSGDYEEILTNWWNDWNWTSPQKDFLPDDGKGGLIVLEDNVPVCAGFVYVTNSKVCWVDWIISSKERSENRKQAIDFLIECLTNVARNSGAKYVYALIKNNSLIKTYENQGYVKADNYNQEMIKVL